MNTVLNKNNYDWNMIQSLRKHWRTYLMELAGLAGFVLTAGLLSIFLEHPDLPVMQSWLKDHPLLRRIPLGIIMGIYSMTIILLFGKKSGAHINPAATWTFYRLGKISFVDAAFFTVAQFAGAIMAAQFLKYATGNLFSDSAIDFGVTKPKPPYGSMAAFVAEFIISFILMLLILMASSSKRFEKKLAYLSGILIAIYLIVEIPFSGMSLNPARSFAGALAANEWGHLWIYFVAPVLAMLAAGEVFLKWKKKAVNRLHQKTRFTQSIAVETDDKEIPHYPVENNN